MQLKRRTNDKGAVTHVEVIHTGTTEAQCWSARQVEAWSVEGWLRVEGDTIILTTAEHQPDLVYTIQRRPGYYCNATGERIPISDLAMVQFMTSPIAILAPREAKAWLLTRGRTQGYTATRNYDCVLDNAQHEQFKKRS